jgi:hypothetical protein
MNIKDLYQKQLTELFNSIRSLNEIVYDKFLANITTILYNKQKEYMEAYKKLGHYDSLPYPQVTTGDLKDALVFCIYHFSGENYSMKVCLCKCQCINCEYKQQENS